MIPQTLGALAAFLALVAPGIVFELARERRRAGRKESAFREAARMALGSLGFSLVASLLLVVLHAIYRAIFGQGLFVSFNALAADPAGYARQHLTLIGVTVVVELTLACGLAVLADLALAKRRHEVTSIRHQSAWRQVFRMDRPANAVPWVHVQLTDGSSFLGYLRSHTAVGNPEEREMVLEGAGILYIPADSTEQKEIGLRWPRVVIPGAQIKTVWVQYRKLSNANWTEPRSRAAQSTSDVTTSSSPESA